MPHIEDITIKNYRIFSEFEADGFGRVNLVAGANGTGKTTLLEALFFVMDRGNLISLLRPLQWRQLPASLEFARENLFSDVKSNHLEISATTAQGVATISYTWEQQKLPSNQAVKVGGMDAEGDGVSNSSMHGFTIKVLHGDHLMLHRGMVPAAEGLAGVDFKNEPMTLPTASMLSRYTMHFAGDLAQRYSTLAKSGQKQDIINIAKQINDQIVDIELFQIGDRSILHVALSKGAMVPATLAGDGVLSMLSIGLAIMNSRGGVVLLDEFDTAVHYSMLSDVWSFIAKLAVEYDCQVFAATHSRECVDSALKGVVRNKQMEDLRYYRLDRVEDDIVATMYNAQELLDASASDWEIR